MQVKPGTTRGQQPLGGASRLLLGGYGSGRCPGEGESLRRGQCGESGKLALPDTPHGTRTPGRFGGGAVLGRWGYISPGWRQLQLFLQDGQERVCSEMGVSGSARHREEAVTEGGQPPLCPLCLFSQTRLFGLRKLRARPPCLPRLREHNRTAKQMLPQATKVGHLLFTSCPITKPVFFIISLPTDTMKYITHLDMGADLCRATCAERFDVERQIARDRKAPSMFLITPCPGSATD